jgi:hypothetical protein
MSKAQYKNRPYVKQYDAEGNLINPIDGAYYNKDVNKVMNRSQRRKFDKLLKKLLKKKK